VCVVRYKVNGFLLSEELGSAVRGNGKIEFTHQEQAALILFLSSKNGFVDGPTLEENVWGKRVVTHNSLRKLISGLRQKFDSKDSIKNIRGRGYELSFEVLEEAPPKYQLNRQLKIASFLTLLVVAITILVFLLPSDKRNGSLHKVFKQTVFESNDYILDYAAYGNALFITTRNAKSSKLYKTVNRQNTTLLSADYAGAFRGIEIHESGKTILHVVEDSKCKIKVFNTPVKNQIDEIPCSRQNAFPSFDWIDETRFYVTFNISYDSSIRPYIYDLNTQRLEPVTSTNFDTKNNTKFIDSFIKAGGNGVFSLRENHLDEMSLMYFEGDESKTLYNYRAKPYSIAVSDTDLFFIGNNNELFNMKLEGNIPPQDAEFSMVLAPQTIKIDDPLMLQGDLYFSLGNASKEYIYSTSGDFSYSLENGVRDFTYTDEILSVLALTNTGYVVEQLKNDEVLRSIYLDTELTFRQLAFFKGELYLAGASGIYLLSEGETTRISQLKTAELVSNGQCLIAEGEDGIYLYQGSANTFHKIAAQGERAFPSERGCLFVDNISGDIVDENRNEIAKPLMRKRLFEHKGRITHWHSVKDNTHFVDIKTGETIAKTRHRVLHQRVVSYKDDILYLAQAGVNTAIVKLRFNSEK
jgi:DNA-binding winged helix-turn-helix (wHTH) protein